MERYVYLALLMTTASLDKQTMLAVQGVKVKSGLTSSSTCVDIIALDNELGSLTLLMHTNKGNKKETHLLASTYGRMHSF